MLLTWSKWYVNSLLSLLSISNSGHIRWVCLQYEYTLSWLPIIFDPIEALNLCLKPPQLRTYYCNQSKTAFSQLNKILAWNLQFTYSILFNLRVGMKEWPEKLRNGQTTVHLNIHMASTMVCITWYFKLLKAIISLLQK